MTGWRRLRPAKGLMVLLLLPVGSASAQRSGPVRRQVCLAPPSVEVPEGSAADGAQAVSETFADMLRGPTLTTTRLTARLASQARQEGKAAGCAYILFASLKHVRKQGGPGLLGKVAGTAIETAASQMPASGTAATAARVAVTAAGSTLRSVAGSVQFKDEMTLQYRLESGSGASLLARNEKRRATADGEDLLSPLVERAAEAIAALMERR